MFDLIIESGGGDELLIPDRPEDKKHGHSMSLYYAPSDGHHIGVEHGLGCCWMVNYLLRQTGFRSGGSSAADYDKARSKTNLLSIDAALAHHPAPANIMPAPGPSPSGIGAANWPPPFDEVHRSATHRGGLGCLSLLLRWDVSLDTVPVRGGASSSGSGGGSSGDEPPEQRAASAERALHAALRRADAAERALEAERTAHESTKQQLEQAQAPHGGEEARGGEKRAREE